MPRIGGGIGLGEKSSLREIAKIECILVLENVEVGVIKLVFENDCVSYMDTGVLPL